MKKTLIAALLALAPTTLAADPVHGMWKTEVDDGAYAYVEMSGCSGGKVCGWIRRTFDDSGEYQSENIGKVIVINMEPQGGGRYEGNVWRPSNDKTYVGKMEMNGDSLFLDGCVLGGLLCKTQTWSRLQ
ncbi:DUF2147 domain-containing protein [Sinisalibacter lacisalsi]|uniref:DUF2147 domain-containing protein n=1 Tax=Sinisalibacter lacisalsi TaxID=1526570 RepID=A0ABQ1QPX3_9RHOB|nr:DUF2147 domain-containing protein [Sinisalibacter lacisalsi]GGD40024.1 hypothetical protein GCM10011358_24950 [Sinisalibacter lacisalsi]